MQLGALFQGGAGFEQSPEGVTKGQLRAPQKVSKAQLALQTALNQTVKAAEESPSTPRIPMICRESPRASQNPPLRIEVTQGKGNAAASEMFLRASFRRCV